MKVFKFTAEYVITKDNNPQFFTHLELFKENGFKATNNKSRTEDFSICLKKSFPIENKDNELGIEELFETAKEYMNDYFEEVNTNVNWKDVVMYCEEVEVDDISDKSLFN